MHSTAKCATEVKEPWLHLTSNRPRASVGF